MTSNFQPLINEQGSANAQSLAERAEKSGIKSKFNNDPQVAIDTFPIFKRYNFFNPDSVEKDKNAFAGLIRMCVHFEIETMAFMQTMGFPVEQIFTSTVDKFMGQNTVDSLKDLYPNIPISTFRELSKDIQKDVYCYLRQTLNLPKLAWD